MGEVRFSFSKDDAIDAWETGNGSTVYIDMTSHLTRV